VITAWTPCARGFVVGQNVLGSFIVFFFLQPHGLSPFSTQSLPHACSFDDISLCLHLLALSAVELHLQDAGSRPTSLISLCLKPPLWGPLQYDAYDCQAPPFSLPPFRATESAPPAQAWKKKTRNNRSCLPISISRPDYARPLSR
jgi:hypothetical protein